MEVQTISHTGCFLCSEAETIFEGDLALEDIFRNANGHELGGGGTLRALPETLLGQAHKYGTAGLDAGNTGFMEPLHSGPPKVLISLCDTLRLLESNPWRTTLRPVC